MQLDVKNEFPPYIPIRKGWPSHRSPWWLLGVVVAFGMAMVVVGLTQQPSSGQQSTDLTTFIQALNADTQSCAGGVHDSFYVLNAIDSGASKDVGTAISVAQGGAANCDPAGNDLLAALLGEQPPESLAKFHLDRVTHDLIVWSAIDSTAVQSDIATVLSDLGKPSQLAARAKLATDQRRMDQERAAILAIMKPVTKALHPTASLLALPG
jgi:hypothetical protein